MLIFLCYARDNSVLLVAFTLMFDNCAKRYAKFAHVRSLYSSVQSDLPSDCAIGTFIPSLIWRVYCNGTDKYDDDVGIAIFVLTTLETFGGVFTENWLRLI